MLYTEFHSYFIDNYGNRYSRVISDNIVWRVHIVQLFHFLMNMVSYELKEYNCYTYAIK